MFLEVSNCNVNHKGNQSWIFTGSNEAEAEAPKLWPPDAKNRLTGKDPDAGKDWRQEQKGMTEDEMVEWYHWLDGHEFEQTLGDSEGQGSLACCNPWGYKELGTTDQLNNSNLLFGLQDFQKQERLHPESWGCYPRSVVITRQEVRCAPLEVKVAHRADWGLDIDSISAALCSFWTPRVGHYYDSLS